MYPTLSERWIRRLVKKRPHLRYPWSPFIGVLTCVFLLIWYLGSGDELAEIIGVALLVFGCLTLLIWERYGFLRLLDDKDAEISHLRKKHLMLLAESGTPETEQESGEKETRYRA